jgi:hypothetical protein
MRSVIHEASSIAKAIEQGWIKAGKPRNFSVKIFEEPQRSFFGLFTAKSAKIGIFVEDRKPQGQDRSGGRRHAPARRRFQHRYEQRPNNGGPQSQQQPHGQQAQQRRPEQPRHAEPQNNHNNDSDDGDNHIE